MNPRDNTPPHRMRTEWSIPCRLTKELARVLCTVLFDLKVDGQHHVPAQGGALLVSNHQSYLDPVLLCVRLARPLNYIAKSELFSNPLGAWLLRNVFNAFPLRQGAGDVAAVKEAIRRLQEQHLLNIFPEGGRSPDGEIARLQRGVGWIVWRAKVPVIPVIIVGSYEAWSVRRRIFRPWPVRVRYGPPMALADLEPDEITAVIDRTLREMFREMRTVR